MDTSDRLMLDFNRVSLTDIGLYNVAYSFGTYFSSIMMAVEYAVGPILMKNYAQKNEHADCQNRALIFIWQILALVIAFPLALLVIGVVMLANVLFRRD